jgi:hypothetical protein
MGCLKLDDGHWANGPTESCFGCLSLFLLSYKTGERECRVFWSKSLSGISGEIERENGSKDLSDRRPRPAHAR